MTEPDAPSDVEVGAYTSHEMPGEKRWRLASLLQLMVDPLYLPPTMTLEEDAPRETNLGPPLPQGRAHFVVQGPDGKATEEDRQPSSHHPPHVSQDLLISQVLAQIVIRRKDVRRSLGQFQSILLRALSQRGSQGDFHDIHAPEDDDGGQDGVGVLVEGGILQVVVVGGDEDG